MNKQIFGLCLIALDFLIFIIVGMLVYKSRKVDVYVYGNKH